MRVIRAIDRRYFLKLGLATTAGLLIGCSAEVKTLVARGGPAPSGFGDAWLHLGADGKILYYVPSSEMGQGVQTALTMIVADEMDADWQQVEASFAPYHSAFKNPKWFVQVTGGSASVAGFWDKLRQLGATARAMLVAAAAERWKVAADDCRTAGSFVMHGDDRKASYGELANEAAEQNVPGEPRLKRPDEFIYIGKPLPRLDTLPKITGTARYGIDVTVPDMLYAAVAQSPVFGGRVSAYDEKAARAMPGVMAVISIPHGIAVVADSYWRARKGLAALDVTFDPGDRANQNSADFDRRLQAAVDAMPKQDFTSARHALDLEYQVPFLAHQPLEPMNCTAHVTPAFCKIWVPTQNQHAAGLAAKKITGLDDEQVEIVTTYLGGGFGRRLTADFVEQAVIIAKAVGKPVKMIWSREEDMQHDFYRPTTRVRFQIALGDDGMPTQWLTRLAAPSFLQHEIDTNFPQLSWLPVIKIIGDSTMKGGLQRSLFEPNPFPYEVGDLDVDAEVMDFDIPMGSHRSVQHSFSGFYKESAIDECAHAAGQDALAYRKKLIRDDARYHGVLDLVAEQANWGRPPTGRYQGISVHRSFDTYVAQVVELSVAGETNIHIHRIICAVDCGSVVNPAIVRAQITGGALWGLDTAFFGEITVSDGRVDQSNFDDYPVLRLEHAPTIDVHIVDSTENPTGVGEPAVPPLAAALANALFAATGTRVRDLPFVRQGYSLARA